jgi:cytochrome c553
MAWRYLSTIVAAALALAVAAPAEAVDPASGDIEAVVGPCVVCHGKQGVPSDPKVNPIIWGQQASYLMKQLRDFRNGNRPSPVMAPIAQQLAERDLRKIANYFAAKPWPAQQSRAWRRNS